jgi:hypothetical protein
VDIAKLTKDALGYSLPQFEQEVTFEPVARRDSGWYNPGHAEIQMEGMDWDSVFDPSSKVGDVQEPRVGSFNPKQTAALEFNALPPPPSAKSSFEMHEIVVRDDGTGAGVSASAVHKRPTASRQSPSKNTRVADLSAMSVGMKTIKKMGVGMLQPSRGVRPQPGRYSASGERLGDISKYVSFSICIFTDTQIISFHVWPRCVLVHLKTKHVNEPNLDPADTVASRILWVLMVQNVSICYATPKL